MTDSLKERHKTLPYSNSETHIWMDDALARIEELEAENKRLERHEQTLRDNGLTHSTAIATIVKLEEENKRLRSELSGRLGQPFGDPAKS